jgi:uncharacterized Tic20 family protein
METPDNPAAVSTDEALTQNEKLAAMFVHLSMFFGGLIVPPVFWIIFHKKSKFVVFHSVQILVFHLLFDICFLVLFGGIGAIYYYMGLLDNTSPPNPGTVVILLMMAYCLFTLAFVITCYGYAVYMAMSAYKGRLKKYPIVGNFIYKKIYAAA